MIVRSLSIYIICAILFLASLCYNLAGYSFFRRPPFPSISSNPSSNSNYNQIIHENHIYINHSTAGASPSKSPALPLSPPISPPSIPTVGILFPEWQVLVVVSPDDNSTVMNSGTISCLFPYKHKSPVHFSGVLPSPNRTLITCELPIRVRRRLPFPEPILVNSSVTRYPRRETPVPELLRWDFIVYDVLFTEIDVVVFVKGLNKRQGINRDPQEFNCVFGDDAVNGIRTAVTSSLQEVFRCQRPDITAESRVKVSVEVTADKQVIPSIAYANPTRKLATQQPKSLLCTCTMVYNVAKFLREWLIYHAKIGVDKFILYDNGSDDDLYIVVDQLVKEGYDISTQFWLWPKTQEAGFSHCAISSKNMCTWMMYTDVDEFIYSEFWSNSSAPSKTMLHSLLPHSDTKIGQITIGCHEFGPSNQKTHPVLGVMQGYNCRKKMENRHKSIVLLDAISDSLLNVVHHFDLKDGYKMKKMNIQNVVINHYKFQAWPEFKAKFRRRVSAYVVDWTQNVNPKSNDRAPGLGYSAVEPEGWPQKFCEVHDDRLKEVAERWFRVDSPSGYRMLWQS